MIFLCFPHRKFFLILVKHDQELKEWYLALQINIYQFLAFQYCVSNHYLTVPKRRKLVIARNCMHTNMYWDKDLSFFSKCDAIDPLKNVIKI